MGYYFALGHCYGCNRLFGFHPELVPSIRPEPAEDRLPVCSACIRRANRIRQDNELPPIEVLPGAYEPAGDTGEESTFEEGSQKGG